MGVSLRGSLALYRSAQALAAIRGRDYVIPNDIRELAVPVFLSRILPKLAALIKGLSPTEILKGIIAVLPLPQHGRNPVLMAMKQFRILLLQLSTFNQSILHYPIGLGASSASFIMSALSVIGFGNADLKNSSGRLQFST